VGWLGVILYAVPGCVVGVLGCNGQLVGVCPVSWLADLDHL
jgi:hypothetical protein